MHHYKFTPMQLGKDMARKHSEWTWTEINSLICCTVADFVIAYKLIAYILLLVLMFGTEMFLCTYYTK